MTEEELRELLSGFGSTVRSRRVKLSFSQEDLAHRAGLHRTYISDVERGARNMTIDSIAKLAGALDIPIANFFPKTRKHAANLPGRQKEKNPRSKAVDILLVEDNPKHVELTLNALEKSGLTNRILVVTTGEEALEVLLGQDRFGRRLPQKNPKVILLDLALPNIGGLEVLRRIRTDRRTQSIPVVILTSSRSDQDYKECVKFGVTAYINKPVDFVEFSTIMPKFGFRWMLLEEVQR